MVFYVTLFLVTYFPNIPTKFIYTEMYQRAFLLTYKSAVTVVTTHSATLNSLSPKQQHSMHS